MKLSTNLSSAVLVGSLMAHSALADDTQTTAGIGITAQSPIVVINAKGEKSSQLLESLQGRIVPIANTTADQREQMQDILFKYTDTDTNTNTDPKGEVQTKTIGCLVNSDSTAYLPEVYEQQLATPDGQIPYAPTEIPELKTAFCDPNTGQMIIVKESPKPIESNTSAPSDNTPSSFGDSIKEMGIGLKNGVVSVLSWNPIWGGAIGNASGYIQSLWALLTGFLLYSRNSGGFWKRLGKKTALSLLTPLYLPAAMYKIYLLVWRKWIMGKLVYGSQREFLQDAAAASENDEEKAKVQGKLQKIFNLANEADQPVEVLFGKDLRKLAFFIIKFFPKIGKALEIYAKKKESKGNENPPTLSNHSGLSHIELPSLRQNSSPEGLKPMSPVSSDQLAMSYDLISKFMNMVSSDNTNTQNSPMPNDKKEERNTNNIGYQMLLEYLTHNNTTAIENNKAELISTRWYLVLDGMNLTEDNISSISTCANYFKERDSEVYSTLMSIVILAKNKALNGSTHVSES